tara:strand:- start:112 stop:483 length:372 start_codon:yes stop_codon:yes gene_type:complete
MKDQNSVTEKETKSEKWDRAHSLFLESLYKADHELRGCSHNQKCYNELMEIREEVISIVRGMSNPHTPKLKPGEKNKLPPVKSINGISVVLLRGALGENYMKDWSEEHLNEWREYLNGTDSRN